MLWTSKNKVFYKYYVFAVTLAGGCHLLSPFTSRETDGNKLFMATWLVHIEATIHTHTGVRKYASEPMLPMTVLSAHTHVHVERSHPPSPCTLGSGVRVQDTLIKPCLKSSWSATMKYQWRLVYKHQALISQRSGGWGFKIEAPAQLGSFFKHADW